MVSQYGSLRDDRLDHVTVNVGQSPIEPVVIVGQLFVIETEQVEYGCIEVPHGRRIDLTPPPEGIGGSVARSTSDPGAEHPASETVRIMIAACGPRLMGGHPPELGRPEDERVVEHSALGQVGNQGGGRLIENRTVPLVIEFQRFVRIPIEQSVDARGAGGTVKVDVTDATFEQSPREDAVATVGGEQRVGVVGPIERVGRLGLTCQIGHFRSGELHACGHGVGRHACSQFRVIASRCFVPRIEEATEIVRCLLRA